MFKRAIPKPTKEQQERQDKIRERGCLACWMECELRDIDPMECGLTEIHHLTVSGRQIGQDETIALGQWHHRSICLPQMSSSDMREEFGPSLAKGSKTFHAHYCSNEELLALQNELIA